jgi:hypothetical protein
MRWHVLLVVLAAMPLMPQAPPGATVPQLFVPFALPGDAARKLGTVVIDAPLTFTRDPAGLTHLGMPSFVVDDPLLGSTVGGTQHLGISQTQILCDAPLVCTYQADGLHISLKP